MFWPDVIDLRSFYSSELGQVAGRAIRRHIRMIWPEAKGETVVGIGYTAPYLAPYLDQSDVVVACMPGAQGVVHWPAGERVNQSLLVDEAALPFAMGTVNRVLMVHAIENTEQVRRTLQEAHRLLTPSGRLLVVAPNRRGIWARSPESPFAHGHSYSSSQLKRLLRECGFTPLQRQYALFLPPTQRRFLLHSAQMIEKIGALLCIGFGGVVLVEAEKQIFAPSGTLLKQHYQGSKSYANLTNL